MFGDILRELVLNTPGAIGALFQDWEGETVAVYTARPFDFDDMELKMFGAYQGIFFNQLRELCTRIEGGRPDHFKIEFATKRVMSFDLKEGYYVVFITETGSNEAIAWRRLSECRRQLLAEM